MNRTSRISKKSGERIYDKHPKQAAILNEANEKFLLLIPVLHYHKLKGTTKYSIDADSRKSPWRIIFRWEGQDAYHVQITDYH